MKVTYMEQLEHHMAWNRDMFCPRCGGHEYVVVHQLEPPDEYNSWYIRCPQCEFEAFTAPTKKLAIAWWKRAVQWRKI